MSDQTPPSVLRVINASRELTASERLLAGEYYRLDRTHEGCYAREDIMARRVALEIRAMKKCRKRLKELGIISAVPMEKDRRRQTVYFTLSDRYHPSEFAKDKEVFQLAEMLDHDIRSVQSGAPISKESVQSGAPNSAVQGKNGCSPGSESVHSKVKIGALQGNPIESVLNKNVIRTDSVLRMSQNESVQSGAPIRTEGSQCDLHKKNGTPNCPHPQGSPEWKGWQRERLKVGSP